MTLRLPFRPRQLLSVLACLLLAASAGAQDLIILQTGQQQPGKIVGVSPAGVQITIGAGASITLGLNAIKEVRMAAPPEFAQAQGEFEARKFDAALAQLKSLEKYKGLPTDWAQQATGMLGDVFVEKGDIVRAEAAYKEYQKFYPGGAGSAQSDVGMARLDVAKKDFKAAKARLEPVAAKAAEDRNVQRTQALSYSQAFYLLGQVRESEGDFAGALDNYLKTVTLFYHDQTAAVQAREKASALRQAHPEIFVP